MNYWFEVGAAIHSVLTSLARVTCASPINLRVPLLDIYEGLKWVKESAPVTPGARRIAITAVQHLCADLEFDALSALNSGYANFAYRLRDYAAALRVVCKD